MEHIMPDREALWGKARDILVIIVIPVSIWITRSIFSLESKAASVEKELKLKESKLQELHDLNTQVNQKLVYFERVPPELMRTQQDVNTLERKYETLDTRGDSLEVKITRVESKMEAMDTNIKEIKTMVQTLVNK